LQNPRKVNKIQRNMYSNIVNVLKEFGKKCTKHAPKMHGLAEMAKMHVNLNALMQIGRQKMHA
jgi:hypothetical protein